MKSYNELIKSRNIPQLFLFGMYRSGTTVLARSLAGDSKIAFVSDPIRPFFNWYRTKLQRQVILLGLKITVDLLVIILIVIKSILQNC